MKLYYFEKNLKAAVEYVKKKNKSAYKDTPLDLLYKHTEDRMLDSAKKRHLFSITGGIAFIYEYFGDEAFVDILVSPYFGTTPDYNMVKIK